MTEEHIKERLSLSYARAVAARAGYLCTVDELDFGTDGTFKEIGSYNIIRKRYNNTGWCIDFQAKASENIIIEDDYLVYDLESDNYNDLVREDIGTPRILLLYVLPSERDEWLYIDSNNTVMKKCAWWYSLKGQEPTMNKYKKRIRIPITQIFTPNELVRLMAKVKQGEDL